MHALKELFRDAVVALLTFQAKLVLKKYKPKIVVVTGSVGKTSAKDAIYTALSKSFFIRRSEKSFNGDIGVPLTVLGVPNGWSNPLQWIKNIVDGASLVLMNAPYPTWLVMEVGADRPGDITKSLAWLTPDVVVATRFPEISVHVEFYDSPEEVIKEELAPAGWLTESGIFVFNADDERALTAKTKDGVIRLSYGFSEGADVCGNNFQTLSEQGVPTGIGFTISYKGEEVEAALQSVVGRTHAYSILAGVAVAVSVGVPLEVAVKALGAHDAPAGRTRLISGAKNTTIIDDTYNSSPAASAEALGALSDIPRAGKRIAVLADMLELGTFSVDEHNRIGVLAARSADILITVGVRAKNIALGAKEAGMPPTQIIECDRGADASSTLLSLIEAGDVVLIKGSQSMRMERVVKSLMKEPERAKDLLVRQDAEWLARP